MARRLDGMPGFRVSTIFQCGGALGVLLEQARLICGLLISGCWLITSSYMPTLRGRRFVRQKQRGYSSASKLMPSCI
jgi:hypothetical protein